MVAEQISKDAIFSVHPWNQSMLDWLRSQYQKSTHAWLFCGQRGLGRRQVALALAAELLSADPRNRELLTAGTHPDLHVLMPEVQEQDDLLSVYANRYFNNQSTGKPKTVITVDQVRELIQKVSTRAHSAEHKVVIVTPAEFMNLNAANALLKVLEEPPPATFFILICERKNLVPATVRSRSSQVAFRTPNSDLAMSWLREQLGARKDLELLLSLANGAPLTALGYAQNKSNEDHLQIYEDLKKLWQQGIDPLALAARWHELGVERVLPWLQRILCDLVLDAMGGGAGRSIHSEQMSWITDIIKILDITKSYYLYDKIGRAMIDLDGPLDKRLLLEDLALNFVTLKAA